MILWLMPSFCDGSACPKNDFSAAFWFWEGTESAKNCLSHTLKIPPLEMTTIDLPSAQKLKKCKRKTEEIWEMWKGKYNSIACENASCA